MHTYSGFALALSDIIEQQQQRSRWPVFSSSTCNCGVESREWRVSCILAALSAQMRCPRSVLLEQRWPNHPSNMWQHKRKREVTSDASVGGHAAFFNFTSRWWRFPFEKEENRKKAHAVENKSVRCLSPHRHRPPFGSSNPRHNVQTASSPRLEGP